MKNKILLLTFLIFALVLSIHAQTGWSNPVTVSGIDWCTDPAISVDDNGVISAFWLKHNKLDVGYYSIVEFSHSFNGGLNWSTPVDITPEYNIDPSYQWGPLWETRTVTDSKNNIHLIYAKGLENKVLIYKKYDGTAWSDDYVIDISLNTLMRFGIDKSDRLFATWALNNTTYYMYCDTGIVPITWTTPKKIHDTIDYATSDFLYDDYNNLHAVGTYGTEFNYRPYYYFFDRNKDSWTVFEEIYSYQEKTLGCSIALSKDDSLYVNTAVGYSMVENNDDQTQRYVNETLWNEPIQTGSKNNWWDRKMFIDSKKVLHVFEINEENDIHSLNHTYGKNNNWKTEVIHSDPDYYIPWFDVKRTVFEDHDEYYVLYGKSGNTNGIPTSHINFQTKRISTGIENTDDVIINGCELKQNYPNPFNSTTQISYSLSKAAEVQLSIFNVKGELVKYLINQKQDAGQHNALFNADDLNSGIYYYQLEIDGIKSETKKMLYLK